VILKEIKNVDLDVLSFSIKLNGKEYSNDAAESLRIDRTILDDEFANQHVRFAYFATLHEIAKDKVARLKVSLETLYAQLDHEKRKIANEYKATQPSFKYTETMCENEIKTDQRYQAKNAEYLDAMQLAGVLGVAREAFAQRKEMLISLGANARASTPDLRILGDRAKEVTRESSPVHVATTGLAAKEAPGLPRRKPVVKTEE
jgi:hypothetical protein